MFMVLSSWQSHCESSPSSFDECRMAPSGLRPKTKPDDLGCESACTGCQSLHPPSPFIIISQPKSWYSFYHRTDGRRLSRASWLVTCILRWFTRPQTVTHPGTKKYDQIAQSVISPWLNTHLYYLFILLNKTFSYQQKRCLLIVCTPPFENLDLPIDTEGLFLSIEAILAECPYWHHQRLTFTWSLRQNTRQYDNVYLTSSQSLNSGRLT